jgi:CBS domain-containing protein
MIVENHFRKIARQADLVAETDTVDSVVRVLAERHETRTVYVVDENDKLTGYIDASLLLRLAAIKDISADFFTMLSGLLARTAEEIMQEPVYVTPKDTMEDALKILAANDLQDLPVVDAEGSVIGDLNCFEILSYIHAGSG